MPLDRNERNLIVIQALDFFTSSLAGIFVTVFLFVNSDLKTTVLFSIVSFSSLLFFLILSGWTLRYIASGTLIRLAILGSATFYLLLFLLRERAVDYIIPLAIFTGCTGGNYWAAFNLNQYIYTSRHRRVKYFGSAIALINALRAVGPLIGGAIITFTGSRILFGLPMGYSLLFLVVSLVFGVSAVLIGKLPQHDMITFQFSHFFHYKRSRPWKYVLSAYAVLGFFDVALGTVAGVLIYLIVKEEVILGATQSIAALLGALGGILAIPLLHKQPRYFWLGVAGLTLGIALFATNQNISGLIFYIVLTEITAPFLHTWLSTVYYHVLDQVQLDWKEKYHFLIERDTALGVARILSYIGIYLFISYGDQVTLARVWLLFLPIFPLFLGVLLYLYEKSSIKH